MKVWQKIVIIVAGIIGLNICGLMVIGFLSEQNIIPNSRVVRGSELRTADKSYLQQMVEFDEDEVIEYFYSTELFTIEGEGQAITNRRVISYEQDEAGTLIVWQARYEDIEFIEPEFSESFFDDTLVAIYPYDEDGFYIFLSNEEGWDQKVVRYIEHQIGE